MSRLLPLILFAAASLHAQTPSAEVVQILANDHIASDVPFEVKPFNGNEDGVSVTFLVTGEKLSDFKKDSLVLESLSADKKIKLPANLIKRAKFNAFFSKVSPDGTYGRFTVTIPVEQATRVTGLKFKGRVTVFAGGATEKSPAVALPAENAPAITIGDFKISRGKGAGGFLGLGENTKGFGVTIEGPLERIKTLVVTAGDKPLEQRGWSGSDRVKTYNFNAVTEPISIGIETWKNRPEVTVPFSFGE